jgi:hypothetical protein
LRAQIALWNQPSATLILAGPFAGSDRHLTRNRSALLTHHCKRAKLQLSGAEAQFGIDESAMRAYECNLIAMLAISRRARL